MVAGTSSILAPVIHRVVPNHFANTMRICGRLADLGYERPGLVIDAGQDARVNHASSAALVWHNLAGRTVRVSRFIYEKLEPRALRGWYRSERPDAIVATDDASCRQYAAILGLPIPGPGGFASTNTDPASEIAGIDELPREVGATALDLLASQIQHGEKGLPFHPTTTQLQGVWLDGVSAPGAYRRKPARHRLDRGS